MENLYSNNRQLGFIHNGFVVSKNNLTFTYKSDGNIIGFGAPPKQLIGRERNYNNNISPYLVKREKSKEQKIHEEIFNRNFSRLPIQPKKEKPEKQLETALFQNSLLIINEDITLPSASISCNYQPDTNSLTPLEVSQDEWQCNPTDEEILQVAQKLCDKAVIELDLKDAYSQFRGKKDTSINPTRKRMPNYK